MSWWSYKPGRHSFSMFASSGRTPYFFTPTRQHPRGLSGHIPKHAAERNPMFGPPYSGRRGR